jgi:2-hydroxy-3-keto-5-methylthiopentenyl-1-phosphate phosphatase
VMKKGSQGKRPMTELQQPILFLDFDGTVSRRDVVDEILEAYADDKWRAIEEEWRAGRMGSRDCLQAQMALVRATRAQLNALLDEIEVDEGFLVLLETCAAHGVSANIVSDGFDYCIQRILSQVAPEAGPLLRAVRVYSSHLAMVSHAWRVEFPFFHQACAHGCATCKPAVMRLLNSSNATVVFVGDGLSDVYAVERADLVFAKTDLAAHCRENLIPHVTYSDLGEVAAHLDRLLRSRSMPEHESATRVSA